MTTVTNSPRIAPLLIEDSNNPGKPVKWNVNPGGTITYTAETTLMRYTNLSFNPRRDTALPIGVNLKENH
jgi:hypothetical protein